MTDEPHKKLWVEYMMWRLKFWLSCMDAAHRLTGFSRVHLWFVRRASACVDWGEIVTPVVLEETEDCDPHEEDWPWQEDGPDCTWCAGDGILETDDPLWDGANAFVRCAACSGTGLRKHQVIF